MGLEQPPGLRVCKKKKKRQKNIKHRDSKQRSKKKKKSCSLVEATQIFLIQPIHIYDSHALVFGNLHRFITLMLIYVENKQILSIVILFLFFLTFFSIFFSEKTLFNEKYISKNKLIS